MKQIKTVFECDTNVESTCVEKEKNEDLFNVCYNNFNVYAESRYAEKVSLLRRYSMI